MQLKKGVLLAASGLAAVGIAALVSGRQGDNLSSEVVGAAIKRAPRDAQASAGEPSSQAVALFDLRSLRRTGATKIHTSSLLQPKSWYAPPPPPPPVAMPKVLAASSPPAPPSAPPMPFMYIGKMIDRQKVVIFLLRNDVQYVAQLNDVLDGTYRVEKISDDDVVLTYLPLNAQQTLTLAHTAEGGSTLSLASAGSARAPQFPPRPAQQPNTMPFAKQ